MPDPFRTSYDPIGLPSLDQRTGEVMPSRRLARLLAFCGRSIDDIVNSRLARREVVHWFKVDKMLERRREVLELERQWNPLGRS